MGRPVVAFLSLGCRVNQYEIRRFIEGLYPLVDVVPFGQRADVTVIDSCAVTRTAERDTRQMVHRARRFSPAGLILLTGCYVDLHPDSSRELEPGVFVFTQEEKASIPGWIAARFGLEAPTGGAGAPALWPSAGRPPLAVQTGCDNRCAYCVIPLVRGPSVSRPYQEVAPELAAFFAGGVAEVILSGINLGAWGRELRPRARLADLLAGLLEATPPGRRLRLGSVEPETVDDDLLSLLAHPRLAPHLHVPLQGTCDETLSKMRRPNRTDQFLRLLGEARRRAPGVAVGSDVIAGFPGETGDAFSEGLAFVETCGFAYLHVFPFSARPGTEAAAMTGLPGDVIRGRAAVLRSVAARLRGRFLDSMVGKTVAVAVEESREDGRLVGMAGQFFPVLFDDPVVDRSRLVEVRCERREDDGLVGRCACASNAT